MTDAAMTDAAMTDAAMTDAAMTDAAANAEVVRSSFAAYRSQDRDAAERLIGEDFVFTSPQDDHVDRAAFFQRCFPTAERFTTQELLDVLAAPGGQVFLRYEYELADGQRYRNVEVATIRDGRIIETQVYFGGPARRHGR